LKINLEVYVYVFLIHSVFHDNYVTSRHRTRLGAYGCVRAAEAAEAALRSPVEPKERQDMDMEAIAHGFVLLIVDLQEEHIWVLFRELANLHKQGNKFRNSENFVNKATGKLN
jgi:hypothetical protein